MASLFNSLLGRGELAKLPEDLQKLVDKARREKKALDEAVHRTQAAAQNFEKITAPLEETKAAIADIKSQIAEVQHGDAIREAHAQIESLEERAKDLAQSHAQTTNSLAETLQSANDLDERMVDLRELVAEVSPAKDDLDKLFGPGGMVTEIDARIATLRDLIREVETRGAGLQDVTHKIDVAETRANEVRDDQIVLAKVLEKTMRGVDETEAKFAELTDLEGRVSAVKADVDALGAARQEASELLGPSGLMEKVRSQSEKLREMLSEYHGEVARVREDQSHIRTSQETALATYDDVRSRMDTLTEKISHESDRVSTVEATMRDLDKAEELASHTERHLNALRALADHVTQKSAALEKQREVVDRAESQLRNLTDIQHSLGTQVKKAQDQVKEVKKANASLEGLRTLNSEVAGRTAKLRDAQATIDSDNDQLRQQLDRLEEEVRRGDDRFRLDTSNLEAISQRITGLRNGTTGLESRFRMLDTSVGRITEVNDQANALAARITTVSSELAEIEKRLERIEAARGEIDDAVRDVASLRGSREEVRDALEQLRGVRAEIERMQVGNTETSAWLATVQDSIREIRGKIALLDNLAGNVEHMRQNADRVVSAASNLDARRETLAVLETRMTELQRTGVELDERTSNLLTSLDEAEHRFQGVAKRASNVDKVSDVITSVSASVELAERRMAGLGEGVESVAGRAEQVEAMSKRVDRVVGDIEQGQQALTAAAEQFGRVTALRTDAAEVVQSLEEQLRSLTAELRTAEKQSEKVGSHAERLEARAGSLRFAEKRLTQFEEKLAQLDQTEQELARSLETLVARQESVDAVREDLQELFRTAERTMSDVRAISAARDDVEETRGALDIVLSKAAEMEQVLAQIEEHQKAIETSEARLAQAQGLLLDIRAGLQTLGSQKAVVDHVIEQSGQLAFEAKEAEGLLEALRREREMTQRIHDAVKELRDDDDSAARAS